MGPKVAQISLGFGADDLDGTVRDERVFHMAGASTENALTKRQLVKLIKDAGHSSGRTRRVVQHNRNIRVNNR